MWLDQAEWVTMLGLVQKEFGYNCKEGYVELPETKNPSSTQSYRVLLEYPTTIGFQLGHLKNSPYTYTVSGGNGRVF